MKKKIILGLSVASLLYLAGCKPYQEELKFAKENWVVGNVAVAESAIMELHEDKGDTADILIYDIELATVSRANCNFERSIKLFNDAMARVEIFEEEAGTKVAEESKALLTNLSYLPYKGYNYDKIMMGVYQTLNYIETKDFDLARVQINRLAAFQKEAERINEKRIEADEKAMKEANKSSSINLSSLMNAGGVSFELNKHYGNAYKQKLSPQEARALYVNPFAYWLSGLYYANTFTDTADKSMAADYFRLGGDMFGNKSKVFAEDYKMACDLRDGVIARPTKLTYVIYETGSAPERDQFKVQIPLNVIKRELPFVAVNFPLLKDNPSYSPNLHIVAGGNNIELETIANFDAIINREFNNDLPVVVTKSLLSAALKALAQYLAAQAAKEAAGEWGGFVANVTGTLYQAAMNDADLRTWMTLPKEIRVARFETPEDGVIMIDGALVVLSKEGVNVVIARRVNAGSALLLRNFDFSKDIPDYAKPKVAAQ